MDAGLVKNQSVSKAYDMGYSIKVRGCVDLLSGTGVNLYR